MSHIYVDTDLYSTFPLQIMQSLKKIGHKVVFVAPSVRDKTDVPSVDDMRFLPTLRSPMLSSFIFFVMLFFYLPVVIRKERPQVVIGNFYEYPGLFVTKLFHNTRLVLDARDFIGSHNQGIRRFVEKILYYTAISFGERLSDGITVASSTLKEELIAGGVTRPAVKVISNGVATDLFNYGKNQSCSIELRRTLRLSEKFIVMYHGSLGASRGLVETIEAFGDINAKYPDIVFFMLGEGASEMLLRLIAEKSLETVVFIHKPVRRAEVPKFVGMCDMGIDPRAISSWARNSCPIKVLEYLAMEKPIISTKIPFSVEIIDYGNCGMLIPSNEPADIAAGIELMYLKRDLFLQMGKIGRNVVEQYYSWDRKATDLEDFLNFIVLKKRSKNKFTRRFRSNFLG